MPVINDPRMPLFSFLVSLLTDGDTQTRFRADPEAVMNLYNLTWDQKVAVYHAGADPLYVTSKPVDGYPRLLDKAAVSGENKPNPVTGDWWASFAQFKAAVDAGLNPPSVPNPEVNDRGKGERASMAGLMVLLGDEIGQSATWKGPW